MAKDPNEWLRQADYDMETADVMFSSARYFYAVFMCHLSIEKPLKGIYQLKLKDLPLKTHSLIYLLNTIGLTAPEHIGKFKVKLNEASVATRYPEELEDLKSNYTKPVVNEIIVQSKEVLQWIKTQL